MGTLPPGHLGEVSESQDSVCNTDKVQRLEMGSWEKAPECTYLLFTPFTAVHVVT